MGNNVSQMGNSSGRSIYEGNNSSWFAVKHESVVYRALMHAHDIVRLLRADVLYH